MLYEVAFSAPLGGSRQSVAIPFGVEKLEWCGYLGWKKFDDLFSHFDTIQSCNRRTACDSI